MYIHIYIYIHVYTFAGTHTLHGLGPGPGPCKLSLSCLHACIHTHIYIYIHNLIFCKAVEATKSHPTFKHHLRDADPVEGNLALSLARSSGLGWAVSPLVAPVYLLMRLCCGATSTTCAGRRHLVPLLQRFCMARMPWPDRCFHVETKDANEQRSPRRQKRSSPMLSLTAVNVLVPISSQLSSLIAELVAIGRGAT